MEIFVIKNIAANNGSKTRDNNKFFLINIITSKDNNKYVSIEEDVDIIFDVILSIVVDTKREPDWERWIYFEEIRYQKKRLIDGFKIWDNDNLSLSIITTSDENS